MWLITWTNTNNKKVQWLFPDVESFQNYIRENNIEVPITIQFIPVFP